MIRKYFTCAAEGTWIVLLSCGVSVLISALAVSHSTSPHAGAMAAGLFGTAVVMELCALQQWRQETRARGE